MLYVQGDATEDGEGLNAADLEELDAPQLVQIIEVLMLSHPPDLMPSHPPDLLGIVPSCAGCISIVPADPVAPPPFSSILLHPLASLSVRHPYLADTEGPPRQCRREASPRGHGPMPQPCPSHAPEAASLSDQGGGQWNEAWLGVR